MGYTGFVSFFSVNYQILWNFRSGGRKFVTLTDFKVNKNVAKVITFVQILMLCSAKQTHLGLYFLSV